MNDAKRPRTVQFRYEDVVISTTSAQSGSELGVKFDTQLAPDHWHDFADLLASREAQIALRALLTAGIGCSLG